MIYVIAGCAVVLFISAVLVLWRITRGPTTLDRMVSLDMVTSIAIGAFALLAAITRRGDLLPVFVVLSIIGFVGSTTMARFAMPIDPASKRVLTREEELEMDAEIQRREEMDEAPLHDVDIDDDLDDDLDDELGIDGSEEGAVPVEKTEGRQS